MSPFKTVSTYGTMLNKLALFNFFFLLGLWFIARKYVAFDFLSELDIEPITFSGLKLDLTYFLPPFILALIFRSTRLHNRLSDLFKIRERYDIQHILMPLSDNVKVSVKSSVFKKHRRELMASTFYKYVSSTDSSIVSAHLVEMVFDQLTWFWICIESLFCLVCFIIFYLILGEWTIAAYHALAMFLLSLLTTSYKNKAVQYTSDEVNAITEKEPRKREIRETFNALSSR